MPNTDIAIIMELLDVDHETAGAIALAWLRDCLQGMAAVEFNVWLALFSESGDLPEGAEHLLDPAAS